MTHKCHAGVWIHAITTHNKRKAKFMEKVEMCRWNNWQKLRTGHDLICSSCRGKPMHEAKAEKVTKKTKSLSRPFVCTGLQACSPCPSASLLGLCSDISAVCECACAWQSDWPLCLPTICYRIPVTLLLPTPHAGRLLLVSAFQEASLV